MRVSPISPSGLAVETPFSLVIALIGVANPGDEMVIAAQSAAHAKYLFVIFILMPSYLVPMLPRLSTVVPPVRIGVPLLVNFGVAGAFQSIEICFEADAAWLYASVNPDEKL